MSFVFFFFIISELRLWITCLSCYPSVCYSKAKIKLIIKTLSSFERQLCRLYKSVHYWAWWLGSVWIYIGYNGFQRFNGGVRICCDLWAAGNSSVRAETCHFINFMCFFSLCGCQKVTLRVLQRPKVVGFECTIQHLKLLPMSFSHIFFILFFHVHY